jgi:hypothetical protein
VTERDEKNTFFKTDISFSSDISGFEITKPFVKQTTYRRYALVLVHFQNFN